METLTRGWGEGVRWGMGWMGEEEGGGGGCGGGDDTPPSYVFPSRKHKNCEEWIRFLEEEN